MTNEEALSVLRNTTWIGTEKDNKKVEEALKALEQTPTQTSLNESVDPRFKSCWDCIHTDDDESLCILRQCIHAIPYLKECYKPKRIKHMMNGGGTGMIDIVMLSRCFQSTEPFEDDDEAEEQE